MRVGACVVRASSLAVQGSRQRNGRAGWRGAAAVAAGTGKGKKTQHSTGSTAKQSRVRASGSQRSLTRSRSRLVEVWQCNFSHAGRH